VILDSLLLLGGAILVVASRTRVLVFAYVLLAVIAVADSAAPALGAALPLVVFAGSAFLKLVVAPAGLLVFVGRYPAARDLRPSLPFWGRCVSVAIFAAAAKGVGAFPGFASLPSATFAAYLLLCSIGTVIVHRNLLAHLVGLLALGTAVTLAGTIVAPQLPESVELGATFDALVATFVGLGLVRAFLAHNPVLDVEALRELRG
jgi:hypothetical protein